MQLPMNPKRKGRMLRLIPSYIAIVLIVPCLSGCLSMLVDIYLSNQYTRADIGLPFLITASFVFASVYTACILYIANMVFSHCTEKPFLVVFPLGAASTIYINHLTLLLNGNDVAAFAIFYPATPLITLAAFTVLFFYTLIKMLQK